MLLVVLLYTFAVQSVRWRTLYSVSRISECYWSRCCMRLLYTVAVRGCCTRLLYAVALRVCCTLEVARVNVVGRVAVLVRCTLAVSMLADAILWKSHW